MVVQLFFVPRPELGGLVNNIMIGHITSDSTQRKLSFPFPPLPEHSILFYPFDKPTIEDLATKQIHSAYGCTIIGPQTEMISLSFGYNHLVIKIGLQPGGLNRLLGIPMVEMLKYKDFDGADLFGNDIKNTVDALANATCMPDMKNIAENFMLSQTVKVKQLVPIDYVLPDILKQGGMIKIDQLSRNACMSNRQFERVFKDRIGLSPKFYSRLVRFGKAWLIKENNPTTPWTQIAYECGYFDQMHLIRDFKVFAGTNPNVIAHALGLQPFSLDNRIFY